MIKKKKKENMRHVDSTWRSIAAFKIRNALCHCFNYGRLFCKPRPRSLQLLTAFLGLSLRRFSPGFHRASAVDFISSKR